MADFEAPSFSLGIDCDLLDLENQIRSASQDRDPSSSNHLSVAAATVTDNDDGFETLIVDDSEPEYPDPHPKPKRKHLPRLLTVDVTKSSSTIFPKSNVELHSRAVVDGDDVEVFSLQEDRRTDEHICSQHSDVCTSSKCPPNRQGVWGNQPGKRKQNVSNGCKSVLSSCDNPVFPKLTISPLRGVQLIDSDTDNPSASNSADNRQCNGSTAYSNWRQSDLPQHVGLSKQQKVNESIDVSTTEIPCEDLEESFHIPRPAMDEACVEYFRFMKHKSNVVQTNGSSHVTRSSLDLDDSLLPAHRYFFHDDPRIQELVRRRLPNFFPLSNVSNRDLEQPCTSKIDYMGQFSRGESSKHADRNIKDKKSSTSRKISRSKIEEASQGWVNPKLGVDKGRTKGAAKRKVPAGRQTAGHWLTGLDGKKVYVGKKGQELTGRVAYMQYRKESGAGSKKAKRKCATKKQ